MSVPKNLNWFLWRIVIERVATLEEIETHWDLCDLLEAHDALDLRDRVEEDAMNEVNHNDR